jgi:hypothetical protein
LLILSSIVDDTPILVWRVFTAEVTLYIYVHATVATAKGNVIELFKYMHLLDVKICEHRQNGDDQTRSCVPDFLKKIATVNRVTRVLS